MPAKYSLEEMVYKTNATYRGGEYFMKCPCHNDRQASLSFRSDSQTGLILLTCHAGCDNKDIIKALVDMGLWEESGSKKSVYYAYTDEQGNELYRVLRYDDKKFPVGRMVDGEFESGLDEIEPVLYRLHELVKVPATDYLFIAEGEKDADTLCRIGLFGTTNYNGGNPDKWQDSYNCYLTGKKLVLLEDNDDMGRRRVIELKKRLNTIATSIDIISFNSMAKGADLTDWVHAREAEGKKPEEIKAALLSKISHIGISAVIQQSPCKTLAQMEDEMQDKNKIEWLLENSLPVHEPFALIGDPGAGKSTAALALGKMAMAWRESKGKSKGAIFYLLLEGNSRNIIQASKELNIDIADVVVAHDKNGSTRLELSDKNVRDFTIRQIVDLHDRIGVALVIFDSFGAASASTSINDPKIAMIMQEINSALDKPGIPIAYINHCRKSAKIDDARAVNSPIGSALFLGQVRTAYLIVNDNIVPDTRLLKLIKSNHFSAPDTDRDYVFIKNKNNTIFKPSVGFYKLLDNKAATENNEKSMKDKAKRLAKELFINDDRESIPSSEIHLLAETNGVTSSVMNEALREMKVDRIRVDNIWHRIWPLGKFLKQSSQLSEQDIEATPQSIPDRLTGEYMVILNFDCIASDNNSDEMVIKLLSKHNNDPFHYKVSGDEYKQFKLLHNDHKFIKQGDTIYITTNCIQYSYKDTPLQNPMQCVRIWPRLKRRTIDTVDIVEFDQC